MWRLVVATVVLWNSITSQPITEDSQNDAPRHARQLDFVHCCPCPSPDLPDLSTGFNADNDVSSFGTNSGARATPVDDCPCRARGSDTQGASSVFSPRAVPFRPFVNQPESPREDQKPLLHPEVDLASSMLETLREVTDEEYQDALARDAARNAARVNELGDVEPESAKKHVTIILNPRDVTEDDTEVTPEATNVQETKCLHPLGTPHLGQVRDTPNVLKLRPNLLHRKAFDMNNGASDVKENVVSLSKGLEGLKLKTSPSVLSLIPLKKANEGNIQSLLKLNTDKLLKAAEVKSESFKSNLGSKIPNLKLTPLLKKNETLPRKPLTLNFKNLRLSTLKTNPGRKTKTSEAKNIDSSISSTSPSNLKEHLSKLNAPAFDLKTLIPTTDPALFTLKNLLNLKDVELIPPKSNGPKIQIAGLNLSPALKDNKSSMDSKKSRKSCKDKEIDKVVGVERSQRFQTEILDTIPHASENNPVFAMSDKGIETTTVGFNGAEMELENKDINTQILDALPSASDNTNIVDNSDHQISVPTLPSTVILETTDADRDLEQHTAEKPIVESDHKLSKDNIEHADDSSLELIIRGDDDTMINAVEFIEENDEPINNEDIDGITFENNGQSFNIDFIEDSSNANNEDNESAMVENENEVLEFGFAENQESQVEDEANDGEILFRENISTDDAHEMTDENTNFVPEQGTEHRRNIILDDDLRSVESQDEITAIPDPNPNANVLYSIKERITLQLETLRNPDKSKILTISRLSIPENKESPETDIFSSKEASDSDGLTDEKAEEAVEMETSATNQVTVQDLSKMSDSLLTASQSHLQESRDTGIECKATDNSKLLHVRDGIDSENRSTELNVQERSSYSDTDSAATTLRAQNVNENVSVLEDNSASNSETNQNDPKDAEEEYGLEDSKEVTDSCPCKFQGKQDLSEAPVGHLCNSHVIDDRENENEMAPQASETIFNTAPQPVGLAPLLQQSMIVQPNPLFNPSSLLPPLSPLNLGDLNLPTLEDITSGLQGLFGENARASNGDELTSSEFVSAEDCSNSEEGMAAGASTNKVKSALSPIKHLQDINLDIFQINPLSQGSLTKIPSLNLNSFKTKLLLPPSLDLKPLKLESTLGRKNGGLLGASLTFGPEKLGSSRKAVSKLGSILNKQGSDVLGNPIGSMPSLDELRSTMRANTQSLLKSPLLKQTLNPLEDTFKSSQALSESLRSHTENTMKNLQQSLASTLTAQRSSVASNADNKFAKPQELFEMVSLAHEDMNDKLHAIHVDLQDRLSSIHDRIIDQSNIPALKTPLLGLAKVEEEPKGTWRVANQRNKPLTRAQSSRLTANPKKVVIKKPKAKVNKPKTKDINDMNPFKISKAASSLTPKSVEVPKLVSSSSATPLFRPLQRDESLKLREPNVEKPKALPTKQFKPFGDFKITIATTPRPTTTKTALRPSLKPTIPKEQPRYKTISKPKASSDLRGFASEPKPSQVPATVRPTAPKLDSEEATTFRSRAALPRPKLFIESRASPSKPLGSETILSKTSPTKISLPKPTESPLVAKMREAIRIRLSRPVQPQESQYTEFNNANAKPIRSNDMTNAASEKNAVILRPEPMKENVSYRCKMVCVRD